MRRPETTVIGTGGLGTALVRAFLSNNITVKSIFNRSERKVHELAAETGIDIYASFPTSPDQLGDLVFITVSDRAIRDVAQQLAVLHPDFRETAFVHCSGNESAQLLQPLKNTGGRIASFHPLQTFTELSGPNDFEDIYFSVQGEQEVFPILEKIAHDLGAYTIKVTSQQKSHLHAAAVMASNYLNVLLKASVQTAAQSGLAEEEAKKALLPLARTALRNSGESSFAEALTGPIQRGDIETVEKHLKLLEVYPELYEIYCVLGKQTVELARSNGDIDTATAETLQSKLQ